MTSAGLFDTIDLLVGLTKAQLSEVDIDLGEIAVAIGPVVGRDVVSLLLEHPTIFLSDDVSPIDALGFLIQELSRCWLPEDHGMPLALIPAEGPG